MSPNPAKTSQLAIKPDLFDYCVAPTFRAARSGKFCRKGGP